AIERRIEGKAGEGTANSIVHPEIGARKCSGFVNRHRHALFLRRKYKIGSPLRSAHIGNLPAVAAEPRQLRVLATGTGAVGQYAVARCGDCRHGAEHGDRLRYRNRVSAQLHLAWIERLRHQGPFPAEEKTSRGTITGGESP